MVVDAKRGHVFAFNLNRARAEIADFRAAYPLLKVDGEAAGPTADVLEYLTASPIGAWIGDFTSAAQASGTGKLSLQLELPLGKPAGSRAGEYAFAGNRLKLDNDLPALTELNGKLAFTNRDVTAQRSPPSCSGGLHASALRRATGRCESPAQGSADLGQLRVEYPTQVAARRVSGTSAWQASILAAPSSPPGFSIAT